MENRSRHYGDVGKWIEKVIDSCKTTDQVRTTRKLIRNFDKQIQNKHIDAYWHTYYYELIQPLEYYLQNKSDEIFNEKLKSC
jgi:hypothetical protein